TSYCPTTPPASTCHSTPANWRPVTVGVDGSARWAILTADLGPGLQPQPRAATRPRCVHEAYRCRGAGLPECSLAGVDPALLRVDRADVRQTDDEPTQQHPQPRTSTPSMVPRTSCSGIPSAATRSTRSA